MGNTQSKTKIRSNLNQKFVNKNTLEILNKSINNTVINTTLEIAKSCTNSIITSQNIKINNLVSSGDINIDSNQSQQSIIDFSCIQSDKINKEILNDLNEKIKLSLNSIMDTELEQFLASNASSSAISELGTIGNTQSDTGVSQTTNTNVQNINKKIISNIIENTIKNNFDQKILNTCINKVVSIQGFSLSDVKAGGTINISISQDILIKSFSNCIQNSDLSSKITNALVKNFGLETKDESITKSETTQEVKASSQAKGTGFATIISKANAPLIMSGFVSVLFMSMAIGGGLLFLMLNNKKKKK